MLWSAAALFICADCQSPLRAMNGAKAASASGPIERRLRTLAGLARGRAIGA